MNYYKIFAAIGLTCSIAVTGCTDLDEKLGSTITREQADSVIKVPGLLKLAYDDLQEPFQDFGNYWGLSQVTTDETVVPTRGGDWDDNGVWRSLHEHIWNADHAHISQAFRNILRAQFSATNILSFKPSKEQAAQARFLRAFCMYAVLDLWAQVPYRKPNESLLNPPQVLKPAEALDSIINDLKAIIPDLEPKSGTVPVYMATQEAAKVLLMKTYLNKGAFLTRSQPTFAAADMQAIIKLADEIIATGKYSLSDNYFDNFAPRNDLRSTENIFTQQNGPGLSTTRAGNAAWARWMFTCHYNQVPSGWNGFSTMSDFYDKYEATDTRRGMAYTGLTNISGLRAGFLIGQQFNQNNVPLKDRKGNLLIFTKDVRLKEDGTNLELTGIRVIKYIPDVSDKDKYNGNQADNDYVFYRYADVLLMKAEAMLRTGNSAGALAVVNQIRVKRGATPLPALDLDKMLDERGRELYWEGFRRQDLIRFGKYLQPWQLKPNDNPRNLLFPIPTSDLAVNKNLVQNPGY